MPDFTGFQNLFDRSKQPVITSMMR